LLGQTKVLKEVRNHDLNRGTNCDSNCISHKVLKKVCNRDLGRNIMDINVATYNAIFGSSCILGAFDRDSLQYKISQHSCYLKL
jgi:hypothetical protein